MQKWMKIRNIVLRFVSRSETFEVIGTSKDTLPI